MNSRRIVGGLGVLGSFAILTSFAWSPTGSAVRASGAAPHHDPIKIHHLRDGLAYSTNWSGYAVTGNPGSVTDARASWVVPAIQGACPATNQYSSFWVGIDGYSDNSVEQTGTDSD